MAAKAADNSAFAARHEVEQPPGFRAEGRFGVAGMAPATTGPKAFRL
ncbi:hypothetical protein [Roseovarius sp. MMSF_3281]|nr:hypothetical protein [Roseovarius sp. MMSF_3281]